MGAWRDFPIPDGSYSDETRPFSQQDVVNYLPTLAERDGTRSPVVHKTAPGLKTFTRIGTGPHRGAHNCEGRRFIVSGRKLYQVDKNGVATDRGTIPGTGRVTMAHNQIANGNQVLIGTIDNSYLWDTVENTLAATGVALQSVDFLNQRFLGVDQQRRFWRHSALADGASWSDLDVYSSESSPDRIVALKVLDGQVYVFNERTIEVFVDQPTETQVFQRTVVIQRGCISGDTIVRIAGTLFFVGDDYIPYRLDGYTPVPIGMKPIVADLSKTEPRKLFGFGWEDRGYLVYYVTAQNGHTWGYDVTNGRWHRRESYGLDRWRINTLVKFEQDWYAGDYSSGLLYRLEWGYVYEGCEIMPRKLRTGVLHNQGNRVRIHGFRLFAETGEDESPRCFQILGDIPDGEVGVTTSGAYTISGGASPYGQVKVIAGSLPTGVTLAANGSWSGAYAAVGEFTWTVRVLDKDGTPAVLTDSASVADGTPVLDGTYNARGTYGAANEQTTNIIPRGEWAFIVADINLATGVINSSVNGIASAPYTSSERGQVSCDLVVAGIGYPINDSISSWRGRLWGVGVANGALTSAELAYLYNGGNGRSFSEISSSLNADAVSLWAKIVYAWQLDQDGVYPDAKGNMGLTAKGTVYSVIDSKFGRCFRGDRQGKLQAVGSNAQALESTSRVTYFAWAFSEVKPADDSPAIISRYSGGLGTVYQGIRCIYVSGT